MNLLEKIEKFAKRAHRGQKDRSGKIYFRHVEAVANGVAGLKEKLAAYLHDVIEDTIYTEKDLRNLGVPEDVLFAVVLLTKEPGYDINEYYKRIKGNEIARKVKLSDLRHNMLIERIPNPKEKDFQRIEKYKEYYEFLSGS